MSDLFQNHATKSGPVECLGQTFPSDDARREHYLKLLAEKLKDLAFRKLEGFPIGSDEDILELSDPPYYTACPNPFADEFARASGRRKDGEETHDRKPFTADISEGKNDPIYNAHSYHTKVPHKAIMRYILHYTQPGDLVFDGFCGTGMTAIAAQLCADRKSVQALGYRVDDDGAIYSQEESGDASEWKLFSRLGGRKALLNDLSPAATFIAHNYNTHLDVYEFERTAEGILADVEKEYGWMYRTKHTDGISEGKINFTVWSDVFICPQCTGEVVFWDAAVDKDAGKAKDEFLCAHCSAALSKKIMERAWISEFDGEISETVRHAKQVPVFINYSVGKKRFEKAPDEFDLAVIEKISSLKLRNWAPTNPLPDGYNTRQPMESHGIRNAHQFYTKRNLHVIAALRQKIAELDPKYMFWFTSALTWVGRENRLHLGNYFGGGGGVITSLRGTWYIASLSVETSVLERFSLRTRAQAVRRMMHNGNTLTSCGSAAHIPAGDCLVDYIFIDPPFGGNLMYSELNFVWESWLKVLTNNKLEAIENKVQGKNINDYRRLMTECFREAFRLLKPGRWMTIEFSNTQASVWNAIQTAIQEAGFVVANVSALDKGKGSFKAVTTTTAVKQDLVISAYKPAGILEERFTASGGAEESVWDFVRSHLRYLPTIKSKNGQLEFIAERDPRIMFDRLVAWFVQHNTPVPMSTREFQSGLTQRFVERDGMIFLPDQVTEYDKKRMQVAVAPQMEMFVSDERSAIDWLTDFLKRRPSTYQEVHTDFISQLGAGWKKHESKPELVALLEDNFIQYDGTGEVPSQIHSYLSTNHKDLRGLEKNSPALVAKAKDRWYVPDPNKAQDLEKKREKALLKEFDHYRTFTGRRLKEFRLEALRAGFRAAWGNKDYQTIIDIAKKVPDEALQEDEKLLTLYDLALTRTEDGI